jgi:hypothetical protein
MTWITSKNNIINDAVTGNRTSILLNLIKDTLKTAGWAVKGSGDGSTNGDMTGVDYLLVYPNPGNSTAWICLENGEGAQIVLQHVSNRIDSWMSPLGGYTSGMGEGPTTRVGSGGSGPPSDEVTGNGSTVFSSAVNPFYASVAYDTDKKSFFMFSVNPSTKISERALIMNRIDPYGVVDLHPYWLWSYGANGLDNAFSAAVMWQGGVWGQGYHPVNGAQNYQVLRPYLFNNSDIYTALPTNPYDSSNPLLECVCASNVSGFEHMRGKIDGMYRVSGSLTVGDFFQSGMFVKIKDFGVPWGDAGTPLL